MKSSPLLCAALLAVASSFSSTFASQLDDVPMCPGVGQPRVLLKTSSTLEAAAFDAAGRLVLSDWLGNRVLSLDTPGSKLRTIRSVWAPGGLALLPDGSMLVGSGIDALALLAPANGSAQLLRVDLETGQATVHAKGLSMANGVVLAKDGTVFASNDLVASTDRIDADGTVHRGWYRASAANGLALSPDGGTLYANVSLGQPRVLAIDPVTAAARTYFQPPQGLEWVFFDDLDIDRTGRLYLPLYFGGHVWRVGTDGRFCALAKGLTLPAGITLGKAGAGFAADSLYVTTHLGRLIEIPKAVPGDGL